MPAYHCDAYLEDDGLKSWIVQTHLICEAAERCNPIDDQNINQFTRPATKTWRTSTLATSSTKIAATRLRPVRLQVSVLFSPTSGSKWILGRNGYDYSNGNKTISAKLNSQYPFVVVTEDNGTPVAIPINGKKTIALTANPWAAMIYTTVVKTTPDDNTDRGGYRAEGTFGWAMYMTRNVTAYANGTAELSLITFGPATGSDPYSVFIEIDRTQNVKQTWRITNRVTGDEIEHTFDDAINDSVYFGYSSNNTADTVTIDSIENTVLTLTDDTDLVKLQG